MHDPTSNRTAYDPFRRIFREDGSMNEDYVRSRLLHLQGLLGENRRFLGLRFDRDEMERLLAENQQIFERAESQESFEAAFEEFARMALPRLVTDEFNRKAREILQLALADGELSRRDRAAAACGLIFTVPESGEAPQPHGENPLFEMVLTRTFNESMARLEFLRELSTHEEMSDAERDARTEEFLRSVPALRLELQEHFDRQFRRALASYERGEFSFGIGLDMVLHGVRMVRRLTLEWEEQGGETWPDEKKKAFGERFGRALLDSFEADIGEDEEIEIILRMQDFARTAERRGDRKAMKGLRAALDLMIRNGEMRHRLLLAGYHAAVTGSRLYRRESEIGCARAVFTDPFARDPLCAYAETLREGGEPARAERVYRAALEFFPEDTEIRDRLTALGEELAPSRNAEVQADIAATELREKEEE